jgi:hypothetical protein
MWTGGENSTIVSFAAVGVVVSRLTRWRSAGINYSIWNKPDGTCMEIRERERWEVGVQTVRFSGGAQPCDSVDEAVESGDAAVVQWRRRWTSCRWQRPSWSVRVRTVGWRQWQWTSCLEPVAPLPLIWHCVTGPHQPRWVGRPRSWHRSGPESAVGLDSEEINSNILPLDLILYFNFKLWL